MNILKFLIIDNFNSFLKVNSDYFIYGFMKQETVEIVLYSHVAS